MRIYTRHTADCEHRADRNWRRCRCPKWLRGMVDGKPVRESAKTRSWDRAEQFAREREAGKAKTEQRVTIEEAVARYLASKQKEAILDATRKKLERMLGAKGLLGFASAQGLHHLADISTAHLDAWRNTWKKFSPLTASKEQHRVKSFFRFCLRLGWIKNLHENPAEHLSRIKVQQKPTDYLPREEFEQLIDATYVYQPKGWTDCRHQAERLRTLIRLMRWSGLAIRDAVTLARTRLNERNELFLYRAKTGEPVFVPLPDDVAHALRNITPGPKPNPAYFFWSGNGDPKSAVADWQRSFRRLTKLAGIKGHDGQPKRIFPHMLRDTFAVEMLLAGVPMDQVSLLLGHSSIKTTEKSYSPFVKARQVQLASSVRQAWAAHDKVTPIGIKKRVAARA